MPGNDWADLFNKWHSLTQRLADNVQSSRLQVSSDDIEVYFQNLSEALERIPETNIFNYDETNVTDNPSQKSALCREGLQELNKKQNIQSSQYQLCLVEMQSECTYHQWWFIRRKMYMKGGWLGAQKVLFMILHPLHGFIWKLSRCDFLKYF